MKVSIIIATHARPAALKRLLETLAPQLVPGRHEVFIAENGTPGPASVTVDGCAPIHIHDSRPGKCRVQNRAIRQACGEIIVCIDDDLYPSPAYVGEVERFFDAYPEYAAMKGRILPAEDPSAKAGPLAAYLDLPIVDHGERVIEVPGVLGANMAFRGDALRKVGPFDERLGPGAAGHEEETEMSRRLSRAGFKIGYAPGALVFHEVDPARADRERFIRIARERGYCRTVHERHSIAKTMIDIAIARARLFAVTAAGAPLERVAREEKRLAIARGIRDGLRAQRDHNAASTASSSRP